MQVQSTVSGGWGMEVFRGAADEKLEYGDQVRYKYTDSLKLAKITIFD
jgi:hypothetical protein